jgi:transcriptional regulator with XRE-family HTH domain
METLGQYVDRIMKEKNLTALDVENRSIQAGNKITDTYVTNIILGINKNLSVKKLNVLADALEVDRIELFKVASGIGEPEESWTPQTLLRAFNKMLHLKPAEIKKIKKMLKIE